MGNPIVLQMLAPPILTSSAQHGYTRQAGGTWKESFAVVTDIRNPYKEAKLHSLGLKATQVSCQWQCGHQQSEWRKTTRLLVSENCVKTGLAPILNAVGGTNTWCWCCYWYRLQSDWSVHVWTRDAGVAAGTGCDLIGQCMSGQVAPAGKEGPKLDTHKQYRHFWKNQT